MGRNNLIKKGVVVAVILLFIGLAFAPSINANISEASLDRELVEITTEVCGLNGGKHTVSLSKEDALEVEQLIDDIERRLDEVETREEAVEIFNEAVVELDKYGLLGGLSIEQAQRLVTGRYHNQKVLGFLEKFVINPLGRTKQNFLCLIAGYTNNTVFNGVLSRIMTLLLIVSPELYLITMMFFIMPFDTFTPINIGSTIGIGYYLWDMVNHEEIPYPANGWMATLGLFGIKIWGGSMRGCYSEIPLLINSCYPGITGFIGLKILLEVQQFGLFYVAGSYFYMGSALGVKIESVG